MERPRGRVDHPGALAVAGGRPPTCLGFLLAARPPQLTKFAATFLASSTPLHTSFHPACVALLTPLRAGLGVGRRAQSR
jgi:hypothetical protein